MGDPAIPQPAHGGGRLPLAAWHSFEAAVLRLGGRLPSDRPVDISAMQLSRSTEKQVVASLRALRLLGPDDVANFRLRRLVATRDFVTVVEALAERFPDLVGAIRAGASSEELEALMGRLDAPPSSKERFWRFVRGAFVAAGESCPAPIPKSSDRVQRRGRRREHMKGDCNDDVCARSLLEAEAHEYSAALERALVSDDLEAAAALSDRLRLLREEMRRPFRTDP